MQLVVERPRTLHDGDVLRYPGELERVERIGKPLRQPGGQVGDVRPENWHEPP